MSRSFQEEKILLEQIICERKNIIGADDFREKENIIGADYFI